MKQDIKKVLPPGALIEADRAKQLAANKKAIKPSTASQKLAMIKGLV